MMLKLNQNKAIKVLLVEDNPGDARLVETYLSGDVESRFEITHVERLSAAIEKLATKRYDIALLDLSLPDSPRGETFDRIHAVKPELPIIIFTGLNDPLTGTELIKKGAQDYLPKNQLNDVLVGRSIRYAIERKKLQQNVAERSARLEESVSDLESFSYTVAHDLRAPIRAMQGFAQALEEEYCGNLDETGIGYLRRIRASAQRMDNLIQDVLLYSRVARAEKKFETVDLEKVLEDVMRDYPALSLPHARITIQRPLHKVIGSYSLVVQCVSNLLNNAVKFVDTNRIAEVRLWTEKEDSRVRLLVQDNGIGIPENLVEKIFDPFQRAHPHSGYPGSGIGLSIVSKAVEKMGGEISVKSEVWKGTVFIIELPSPPEES
ncbi:MAG: hybrid sensor histidine kinase/response regulator [Verrucomicrobia bacterium]|nr:hybrid sensor histidine kinase/response regulator [Verrucomicrobiota bacterium]